MINSDGAERNGRNRALIAFLIGVILILLHILFEHYAENIFAKLAVEIVKEVGFALIVSVIIWLTFEFFSSSDREKEWQERVNQLTNDVFRAVLQRNLPGPLMEAMNNLALKQVFMRKNFDITYTLIEQKISYEDGSEFEFVVIDGIYSYEIQNITDIHQRFHVKMFLSGHRNKEASQFCRVNRVTVTHGNSVEELDISDVQKAFGITISEDIKEFDTRKIVYLGPGDTASIFIQFTTPKDINDSEFLLTYLPADGMQLTVIDNTGRNLTFGASSIHPNPLRRVMVNTSTRMNRYDLQTYLLPYQGLQVYWTAHASPQAVSN